MTVCIIKFLNRGVQFSRKRALEIILIEVFKNKYIGYPSAIAPCFQPTQVCRGRFLPLFSSLFLELI